MCDDASDFSGVEAGDKLWSVQLGECEVIENEVRGGYRYIGMSNGVETCHYGWDGRVQTNHAVPSLFWSRPEIIAPPKPRRKVVKTVEAWANVYPGGLGLHGTALGAMQGASSGCICQVKLTGSYEVEE